MDEDSVYDELIHAGFKGIVKSVFPEKLPVALLGKPLNQELVATLKEFHVSLCGEYGEYHTFVYDGPIFRFPVEFQFGEVCDTTLYKSITTNEYVDHVKPPTNGDK